MRGLRRGVRGRAALALAGAVLAVAIVLAGTGIALADKWTDISDVTWQSQYGVTANEAATVAGGFQDGSFHPKEAVKRGQFAKMVVDGFGVAYSSPAVPSFNDVIKSNIFYKYIEGGVKAGLISGFSDGTFRPNSTISRQQANNILGSFLAKKELSQKTVITGSKGIYTSLGAWYAAEGVAVLAAFHDATHIASVHAPGTAYLVYHEVVKGSNGNLTPGTTLTRAQAVALIIRVGKVTFGGGTGGIPTVTSLNPAAGAAAGGNGVVIAGTGFTGATAVKFGTIDAGSFTVNSATQITATAPAATAGTSVDVTVTTPVGTSVATALSTKYSYGAPTITKLEPNGGSAAGSTSVTITGTGFTGVTFVMFGNVAAKSFTVMSPTQILAVSPPGTTGSIVDVMVNTPAGNSVTGTATKYTYGLPVVTKVDPASGAVGGGNTVTITGTGFTEVTGAAGVKFGTVNATSYTVNSTTQITAVVPAPVTGTTTVDVIVTNTVGPSSTSPSSKYSYGGPTITVLNPTGGPAAGGNLVGITGTGFTGVTSVKFGSVSASGYTVVSATDITATAPPGTAGTTVEVTVTTPAGTSTTTGTANDYTYGIPGVTSLNPAAGPTTSGNTVVITGNNFLNVTAVMFGTTNAISYVVNSSTQITASAPSGTAGVTIDVTVTNGAGTSAPVAGSKYSFGAPIITTLNPTAGPTSGANQVVITGKGFTGVSAVKFGSTNATYTVDSPTQITATAPFGNLDTIVDVSVTSPAGTSAVSAIDKYRYIAPPTVASLTPSTGPAAGGNQVVITGTYFVAGAVTAVKFGSSALTLNQTTTLTIGQYRVDSETQITTMAPAGTAGTTVNVSVTNSAGASLNTPADDYSYGIPTVTALNPAAGPTTGLNTVIITGSSFTGLPTTTGVVFRDDRGTPSTLDDIDHAAVSFTVNSLTQITAVVPAQVGGESATVDVIVTNVTGSSATSLASKYSYGAPSITSLSPSGGPLAGGNTVVITGTGFTGVTGAVAVKFGVDSATSYTVVSPTQITATAPLHSTAAVVQVSVTNPAGTSLNTAADDYAYGGPTITSVVPAAGPLTGSNSVVIHGTGFDSTSTVMFGTVSAVRTVDSATQITATVPAHAPTPETVRVKVTTSGLETPDTPKDDYSFGAPAVTLVNPSGGPAIGGNTVVITGYGFSGVSSVQFGAAGATFVVDSPTQITVAAAPGGSGIVDITITTPAGTSATSASTKYSYGVPTITSLTPAAGAAGGGNSIVISGTNLSSVTAVLFGFGPGIPPATPATSFSYNSTTQKITAVAPDGPDNQAVKVWVQNSAGSSSVSTAPDLTTWYTFGAPQVTHLTPPGGPSVGGSLVIITGDGFTGLSGATAVKFGTVSATSYTVTDATHISAIAPAGSGTVDVTVINPAGASATSLASKYSYGLPTVTSVGPLAGPSGGGNLVTINGTNFTGVTDVRFGGVTAGASHFNVLSSTQISAIAPPGVPDGTVDVTVINGDGTSVTSATSKYSYGVPTISLLSPNNGQLAGGYSCLITGNGFTGVSAVKFGANVVSPANYTVNSPTQITVTSVPAGTAGTTVDVLVTNPQGEGLPGGSLNDFTYGLPTVTMISPAAGAVGGGNTLVINGTNFPTTGPLPVVHFGSAGDSPSVIVDASTQIRAIVPAGSSGLTVDVTVQTTVGTTGTSLATKYSYGVPAVLNLNPAAGAATGGNTLIISGTGFTGVSYVKFGGVPLNSAYYTVNGPTQITVTNVPAGTAGTDVEVTVVNPQGGSSTGGTANNYTYGIPVVTSVTPAAGPFGGGAASIVITGKGFLAVAGANGVRFGTTNAISYAVNSATQITVTNVPAGTPYSTVDVYVTNPAGTSLSSDATSDTTDSSKYSYGIPQVISVSPAAGYAGNTLIVTGTGFTGVSAVTFGGTAAGYTVDNPTQLRVTVPGGVIPSTVDIYVTTPAGTSVASSLTSRTDDSSYFSYGPPGVTLLSPNTGTALGGTVVNITGFCFTGVTQVRFGGVAALSFTVVSPTFIQAVAPPGTASTGVPVYVTNSVGDSTGSLLFTYL